jgi:hypothetical protein
VDERDELEFGGLGCLYGLWFWVPVALIAGGLWLVRRDDARATVLGAVLLLAGAGCVGAELLVRRRAR